jgi:hypothetical protein
MRMSQEVREAAEFLLESNDYVHVSEVPNLSYVRDAIMDIKMLVHVLVNDHKLSSIDKLAKIVEIHQIASKIEEELGDE